MRKIFIFISLFAFSQSVLGQHVYNMNHLLYGVVAYYDEYMPYKRLDKDIQMMKAAGINVVRIAEVTWHQEPIWLNTGTGIPSIILPKPIGKGY